jgi:hypothetical protein
MTAVARVVLVMLLTLAGTASAQAPCVIPQGSVTLPLECAAGLYISPSALTLTPDIPIPPQTQPPLSFYGGYLTVEGTAFEIDAMAAAYPHLMDVVLYGQSHAKNIGGLTTPAGDILEGYDLRAMKITNKAIPGPKPLLILTTGLHARELPAREIMRRFAHLLVERYGIDAQVTWTLDNREVLIVLDANPDGVWMVALGMKYGTTPFPQRKSLDLTGCTRWTVSLWKPTITAHCGLDLNRNNPDGWGPTNSYTSTDPNSQYFRGAAPAIAPELTALQGLVAAQVIAGRKMMFTSLHDFGRKIGYPRGDRLTPASPLAPVLAPIAQRLAALNSYSYGQIYSSINPSPGSFEDTVDGMGIRAIIIEMMSGVAGDFPAYSTMPAQWDLTRPVLLEAAKIAGE